MEDDDELGESLSEEESSETSNFEEWKPGSTDGPTDFSIDLNELDEAMYGKDEV